jgi:hypothetical protein
MAVKSLLLIDFRLGKLSSLLGSFSFKMGILLKRTLKVSDDEKTTAAELTLRQSIYPLCLVTILFFLWVSLDLCLL